MKTNTVFKNASLLAVALAATLSLTSALALADGGASKSDHTSTLAASVESLAKGADHSAAVSAPRSPSAKDGKAVAGQPQELKYNSRGQLAR